MPSKKSLQELFEVSLELERRYEWRGAAEKYSEALGRIRTRDLSRRAGIIEEIARCQVYAALQAETKEGYIREVEEAAENYRQAAELYGAIKTQGEQARADACGSKALFLESIIQRGTDGKRRLLEDSRELLECALGAYEQLEDNFGVARSCVDLVTYNSEILRIESDKRRRTERIREGIRLGEKAIRIFSDEQRETELSTALSSTSRLLSTALFSLELERAEALEIHERALDYAQKALDLSRGQGDHEGLSRAHCALGTAVYRVAGVETDEHLRHYRNAMEEALITRNKKVLAEASWNLCQDTVWRMHLEEDPARKEEEARQAAEYAETALMHSEILGEDGIASLTLAWLAETYSHLATETKTTSEEKAKLYRQAVEMCREAVAGGRSSGVVFAKGYALHQLSKTLYSLSMTTASKTDRKRLLDEAHRSQEEAIDVWEETRPSDYWHRSLSHNYLGLILSELADLKTTKKERSEFLAEAVSSIDKSIELCAVGIEPSALAGYVYTLATYQDRHATALRKLHKLTGDEELLDTATNALVISSKLWTDLEFPGRAAEAHWSAAIILNELEQYTKAAKEFSSAAHDYRQAAKKMAHLADYYLDYASYMSAWKDIEKARNHHRLEEFSRARALYESAVKNLEATSRFLPLASYYAAEVLVEAAEDRVKEAKRKAAVERFRLATKAFSEAREALTDETERAEAEGEVAEMRALARTARFRSKYCMAREMLEEAEILSKSGDKSSSAEMYGEAAGIFGSLGENLGPEREGTEFISMALFCQAWRQMKLAEIQSQAEVFEKGARLFLEAKEGVSGRVGLMCLGNAHYCTSMASILRFVEERKPEVYLEAKKHLEAASSHYLKGRFGDASAWAEAASRLLDAYVYMGDAETEKNPARRAELYRLAEKCLESSAQHYEKTGYNDERDEVLRVLERARGERKFAVSLMDIVKTPTSASTTTSLSSQVSALEEAVGLEALEHPNVLGHLSVPFEVKAGSRFDARLDLVNTGKGLGLLVRIDQLTPEGLEIVLPPERYRLEDDSLNMKGARLRPFQVESLTFTLRGREAGRFVMAPRILFVDEFGRLRTQTVQPVHLTVERVPTFKFKTETSSKVFQCLVEEFVKDYMRRKIYLEKAGWRSRTQIASRARVSRSSLYGRRGELGSALRELVHRGVVERRIFPGERGRGGKIVKVRIDYDREPVKKHVDERVMAGV